jgi:hypothetical protein
MQAATNGRLCGTTTGQEIRNFRTKEPLEASRINRPPDYRGTYKPNQKVQLQESTDAITRI